MPQLLTHYWRIREVRRAMNPCACETPGRHEEASCAERLEYIALFAQAGYFNMGTAVDLFQPPPF
ncbi:hypothetical protein BTHE68_58720 (plasmid) [Burkholderia sp. THE68]|uniref:hypothetical protein n=1 Tax=Burkholderia sp. THE68 TaxID=758782 RepID=UPI001315C7DF|nr:hypothetical protein [Burkholderia sp. THE68]BBU32138.1 hypothetical protein BTHE68_58720 [Burkholderia sp. THE68]